MNLGLQVFKECCKNCLLSKDRIVPAERVKEIIDDCKETGQYFICHKASIGDQEIVCAKFYQDLGHISRGIQIAKRLGVVVFVDQVNSEKFSSYIEMSKSK